MRAARAGLGRGHRRADAVHPGLVGGGARPRRDRRRRRPRRACRAARACPAARRRRRTRRGRRAGSSASGAHRPSSSTSHRRVTSPARSRPPRPSRAVDPSTGDPDAVLVRGPGGAGSAHEHSPTASAPSGPADLLALVPILLGFHPEDSVGAADRGGGRRPRSTPAPTCRRPRRGGATWSQHLVAVARRATACAGPRCVVYTDDAALAEVSPTRSHSGCARPGSAGLRRAGRRASSWWSWWVGGRHGCPGRHPTTSAPTRSPSRRSWTAGWCCGAAASWRHPGGRPTPRRSPGSRPLAEPSAPAWLQGFAGWRARAGDGRRPHLVAEGRWVSTGSSVFLDDGGRLDEHDVARLPVVRSRSRCATWPGRSSTTRTPRSTSTCGATWSAAQPDVRDAGRPGGPARLRRLARPATVRWPGARSTARRPPSPATAWRRPGRAAAGGRGAALDLAAVRPRGADAVRRRAVREVRRRPGLGRRRAGPRRA